MFILGEFFHSLAFLVDGLCQLMYWLLMARIIVSWLPVDPYHSVVQFLMQVTDPILSLFRRIPLQIGALDLSPLVAFFVLSFVNRILVHILMSLAVQFGGVQ